MNHGSKKKLQELARRDAATEQRDRILRAFRATFRSDDGKLVLDTLRASAGIGRPAFLPSPGGGHLDPYAAAFRDGRKSIVEEIESHLALPEDKPASSPGVTK